MGKPQAPQTLTGLAKMLAGHSRHVHIAPDADAAKAAANRSIINISGIPGFDSVGGRGRRVRIWAGATIGKVLWDVSGENGLLKQAISMMANPLVRNRVTVLEALNPESHYFDLATAILALDAKVRLQSPTGSRMLPFSEYLLRAATDIRPGEFPALVEFSKLDERIRVGFFRVNPGPSKNTVSAAVRCRLQRNIAIDPEVFVSSSTVIPLIAPLASKALSRCLLSDNNVKMVAEKAAEEMLELEGIEEDPYESSLIEVAVSRAIRRLKEGPSPDGA